MAAGEILLAQPQQETHTCSRAINEHLSCAILQRLGLAGLPVRRSEQLTCGGYLEKSTFRVLIVDDSEPWRRFLLSSLSKWPELQVVGEASDGREAVHKSQELQPDLILLDIGLPTMNGIEAAREIRQQSPNPRILF